MKYTTLTNDLGITITIMYNPILDGPLVDVGKCSKSIAILDDLSVNYSPEFVKYVTDNMPPSYQPTNHSK